MTPWTAAHQAPPSMGFSRQEYSRQLLKPQQIIIQTNTYTRDLFPMTLLRMRAAGSHFVRLLCINIHVDLKISGHSYLCLYIYMCVCVCFKSWRWRPPSPAENGSKDVGSRCSGQFASVHHQARLASPRKAAATGEQVKTLYEARQQFSNTCEPNAAKWVFA